MRAYPLACALLVACGGAGTSPSGDGGAGAGDMDHHHTMCVTWTADPTYMNCRDSDTVFASFRATPPTTCLGSTHLCGTTPIFFEVKIDSGFAVANTATLLFCSTSTASCVPASGEGVGESLAVTLTWDQPNGATGPTSVLRVQQMGSSAGTCGMQANATHIRVTDDYGNAITFPFVQTACCSTDGSNCDP